MVRLRRWLGSSKSSKVLLIRVNEALAHCPKQAYRQRALLYLLDGEFAKAAKLLASAKSSRLGAVRVPWRSLIM